MALITGASSGIGAALAAVFAEHGHQVCITARRKEHLDDIASAIAAGGHKRPIVIPTDLGIRGAKLVFVNAGLTTGGRMVNNVVQEFLLKRLTPSARNRAQ